MTGKPVLLPTSTAPWSRPHGFVHPKRDTLVVNALSVTTSMLAEARDSIVNAARQ